MKKKKHCQEKKTLVIKVGRNAMLDLWEADSFESGASFNISFKCTHFNFLNEDEVLIACKQRSECTRKHTCPCFGHCIFVVEPTSAWLDQKKDKCVVGRFYTLSPSV